MKCFSLIATILLFFSFLDISGSPQNLSYQDTHFFDDLEQQAMDAHLFDTIEHTPPHPLMVWVRIIGLPILNTYLQVAQKIKDSWNWVVMHTIKKEIQATDEKTE